MIVLDESKFEPGSLERVSVIGFGEEAAAVLQPEGDDLVYAFKRKRAYVHEKPPALRRVGADSRHIRSCPGGRHGAAPHRARPSGSQARFPPGRRSSSPAAARSRAQMT